MKYLLFLIVLIVKGINGCVDIIATNITSFESIFIACGVVVLQTESPNLPINVLIEKFLSDPITHEQDLNYHASSNFSPQIRKLFPQYKSLPPFALTLFESSSSLDGEFCVLFSSIPCRPLSYRFVEIEEGDLFILDPARSSFRLCDPQMKNLGCVPPKSSVGSIFHYQTRKISNQSQPTKNLVIVDPIGNIDDHEQFLLHVNKYLKV